MTLGCAAGARPTWRAHAVPSWGAERSLQLRGLCGLRHWKHALRGEVGRGPAGPGGAVEMKLTGSLREILA